METVRNAWPPQLESWDACFQTYKSTRLIPKYPAAPSSDRKDAAEDRCRAERLERARRQLNRALIEGRLPMNLDFNPQQPYIPSSGPQKCFCPRKIS
jgi:hypothetical protein